MLTIKAQVITNFGGAITVKTIKNDNLSCTMRNALKGEICVGDNVEIQSQDNTTPVITKILPRKSLISRPNLYKRKNKNIAANIDQAIIVIAHSPEPIEHYIDRYLVALHQANITPVIVVNKIDNQTEEDKIHLDNICSIYKNIGYNIFYISALDKTNINDFVTQALEGQTSIFIGQSGVGKSEILNSIIGKKITETNQVSSSNKKGKHTTTCSTLYEIDNNTIIIDSPGIREFGLWHFSKDDLFNGFMDFAKYRGMCKFRNCPHEENSLGCAIVENVKNNNIDRLRYKNFHRILKELS